MYENIIINSNFRTMFYEEWEKEYFNNRFIDIISFLNENDVENLKKLDI